MARKNAARKTAGKAPARKMAGRRTASSKTASSKTASSKMVARKKPAPRTSPSRSKAATPNLAPVRGADRRDIVGGVVLEIGRAGTGRVKRMVYPPGFRWSRDMQPIVGTDYCMHAHVGFLVQGEIHVQYADGCVEKHKAPQIVAVAPGHDGRVIGNIPAIMIEFDFERDTVERLGMANAHRHE